MFYDLNIPWSATDPQLARTLAFSHELGYNVVALNHTISGKLPADITCTIPTPLALSAPLPPLTILRRVTLHLTSTYQNARLAELARAYDILAVQPVDERTFTLACKSLDCDIITLDLSQRFAFYFPYKLVAEAVKAGKKFEICYGQGIAEAGARRMVIQNATQLVRACRGRGVVVSSGAKAAGVLRGPWDVVNLANVWGLGRERGAEAVGVEARSVVVTARLRRTSYRGVVDVVYGGEKAEDGEKKRKEQSGGNAQKRKAGDAGMDSEQIPLSKTQLKKRAKQAKLEAAKQEQGGVDGKRAVPRHT